MITRTSPEYEKTLLIIKRKLVNGINNNNNSNNSGNNRISLHQEDPMLYFSNAN